ncbi:thioredoxin-like protein [Stachybotrys elegans]|uniref:Thioredoxin-like protein n=1 Tax=Stachybotrys elegans TaxID=80388 RepID=A0A8K0WNM0_9HYPO|nr:thioredoxin-like protein [Stachybotrys elegans]
MCASSSSDRAIKIEGHVDFLCPWSYLAERTVDAAIQTFQSKHPGWQFEVIWRPFILFPDLGTGISKREFYDKDVSQTPAAKARLRTAGSKYGVIFSWLGRTGSSRNAHTLSNLVLERLGSAAQARVVEQLFAGHFEHGRDISSQQWLLEVGCQAGLPEEEVRAMLRSDAAARATEWAARRAREQHGVEAVPCMTVQSRFRVGGYQDQDLFETLFEKIKTEKEASAVEQAYSVSREMGGEEDGCRPQFTPG